MNTRKSLLIGLLGLCSLPLLSSATGGAGSGNIFNNGTGRMVTSNDSVTLPNYGYTLDATTNVPTRVKGGAGNR